MQGNYDANCTAQLSSELDASIAGSCLSAGTCGQVRNGKQSFAVLTCIKHVGNVDLNLTHPFEIWKDVVLTPIAGSSPAQCQVQVTDHFVGSPAGTEVDTTYT